MMTDENMPENLYQHLLNQSKEDLIEIMVEALENMQHYNGQPVPKAIVDACKEVKV